MSDSIESIPRPNIEAKPAWPQVAADVEFRRVLAGGGSIDWDIDAIAGHLRENDLTDEQIRNIDILLAPAFGSTHRRLFDRRLFVGQILRRHFIKMGESRHDKREDKSHIKVIVHDQAGANKTLFHELQHAIDCAIMGAKAMGQENAKSMRPFIFKRLLAAEAIVLSPVPIAYVANANVWQSAIMFTMSAITGIIVNERTSLKEYLAKPAEQRAFDAENAHDEQVITLEYSEEYSGYLQQLKIDYVNDICKAEHL